MTILFRKLFVKYALILSFLLGTPAYANNIGSPVILNGVQAYEIKSTLLKTPLKLYVIDPGIEAGTSGYPVIYAFDADLSLGLMSTMVQQFSRQAQRSNLTPPLVVAIGYGDAKLALKRRLFDLTPFAEEYKLHARPNAQPWPNVGGGNRFLQVLNEEVKTFVQSRYKINLSQETLYGHSLGGLLVLHALQHQSDQFDRYVAASPSLWFNQRKTLHDVIDFHTKNDAMSVIANIPLRLSVGGGEESVSNWNLRYGKNLEARKEWLKKNRMIGNAIELAKNLMTHSGPIKLDFEIYEGLNHTLANVPAFYDALRFAIEPNVAPN